MCSTDCQENAIFYENNTKLYSYGIGTINNRNLVVESGPGGTKYAVAVTSAANNAGVKDIFKTAIAVAYLRQSE